MYLRPLNNDAGVFAYTGQIISEGGLPYRDSWDHKGPVIYILNSLGYQISDSITGIYALEFFVIFMGINLSMNILKKVVDVKKYLMALTACLISYIFLMQGGNFTETWNFGFQLVNYSILLRILRSKEHPLKNKNLNILLVLQGGTLIVSILMRPNNGVGMIVATIFSLLIAKKYRGNLIKKMVVVQLLPVVLVLLSLALYLNLNKIWDEFFSQYLIYNFYYSTTVTVEDKLQNMFFILKKIIKIPLVISFLVIFTIMRIKLNKTPSRVQSNLFLVIFFFDFISTLVSGKPYLHYLICLLPSMLVLNLLNIEVLNINQCKFKAVVYFAILTILVFALSLNTRWYTDYISDNFKNKNSTVSRVSKILASETNNHDFVYIWGASTKFLVEPFRKSASSLTYIYPLLSKEDFSKNYANKLFLDLVDNKPKIILQEKRFCLIESGCTEFYPEYISPIILYVQSNYSVHKTVDDSLLVLIRNPK
jgi:hypothetical protein